MDLSEFLLARIAEDETRAGQWNDEPGFPCWECGGDAGSGVPEFDGKRVLAECGAKRRIVEFTERLRRSLSDDVWIYDEWADEIQGALAQPYADHPDFRDEWRSLSPAS